MQAPEVGTSALGNHEDRVTAWNISGTVSPMSFKCYADVISPRFEPPKKKRTKSKTDVCARCRESKVRCGAERPCARCIKHNLRDSCVSWRQEENPSIKLSLPSIKNLKTEATLTRVIPSTILSGLLVDEPAEAGRPDLPTDIRSGGTAATERCVESTPDTAKGRALISASETFVSVLNDKSAWDHVPHEAGGGGWLPASTFMLKADYDMEDDDDELDELGELWDGSSIERSLSTSTYEE